MGVQRMQSLSTAGPICYVWSFQIIRVKSVIMDPLSYIRVFPSQLICTCLEGCTRFFCYLLLPQPAEDHADNVIGGW